MRVMADGWALRRIIDNLIAKIDQTTRRADQFCELAERLKAASAPLYNPTIPHWIQNALPATGGGALVTAAFAVAGDINVPWLQGAAVFNAVNLFFGLGGLITPLVAARLFQNNASRLLVLDGQSGACHDSVFRSLPEWLNPGDLLVFNDTRVIKARLHGVKASGGRIEALVERVTGAEMTNSARRLIIEYYREARDDQFIPGLMHPVLGGYRIGGTIHFVVNNQGQYLVMDYIEGEDLRQRMERIGNIPEEEAILIGASICDALAYLHTRKPPVLHRDIKPGNVKITPEGHVYLVDFGLAKMVRGNQATTTGARAMTPGYSPPEQYGTARTAALGLEDLLLDCFGVGISGP